MVSAAQLKLLTKQQDDAHRRKSKAASVARREKKAKEAAARRAKSQAHNKALLEKKKAASKPGDRKSTPVRTVNGKKVPIDAKVAAPVKPAVTKPVVQEKAPVKPAVTKQSRGIEGIAYEATRKPTMHGDPMPQGKKTSVRWEKDAKGVWQPVTIKPAGTRGGPITTEPAWKPGRRPAPGRPQDWERPPSDVSDPRQPVDHSGRPDPRQPGTDLDPRRKPVQEDSNKNPDGSVRHAHFMWHPNMEHLPGIPTTRPGQSPPPEIPVQPTQPAPTQPAPTQPEPTAPPKESAQQEREDKFAEVGEAATTPEYPRMDFSGSAKKGPPEGQHDWWDGPAWSSSSGKGRGVIAQLKKRGLEMPTKREVWESQEAPARKQEFEAANQAEVDRGEFSSDLDLGKMNVTARANLGWVESIKPGHFYKAEIWKDQHDANNKLVRPKTLEGAHTKWKTDEDAYSGIAEKYGLPLKDIKRFFDDPVFRLGLKTGMHTYRPGSPQKLEQARGKLIRSLSNAFEEFNMTPGPQGKEGQVPYDGGKYRWIRGYEPQGEHHGDMQEIRRRLSDAHAQILRGGKDQTGLRIEMGGTGTKHWGSREGHSAPSFGLVWDGRQFIPEEQWTGPTHGTKKKVPPPVTKGSGKYTTTVIRGEDRKAHTWSPTMSYAEVRPGETRVEKTGREIEEAKQEEIRARNAALLEKQQADQQADQQPGGIPPRETTVSGGVTYEKNEQGQWQPVSDQPVQPAPEVQPVPVQPVPGQPVPGQPVPPVPVQPVPDQPVPGQPVAPALDKPVPPVPGQPVPPAPGQPVPPAQDFGTFIREQAPKTPEDYLRAIKQWQQQQQQAPKPPSVPGGAPPVPGGPPPPPVPTPDAPSPVPPVPAPEKWPGLLDGQEPTPEAPAPEAPTSDLKNLGSGISFRTSRAEYKNISIDDDGNIWQVSGGAGPHRDNIPRKNVFVGNAKDQDAYQKIVQQIGDQQLWGGKGEFVGFEDDPELAKSLLASLAPFKAAPGRPTPEAPAPPVDGQPPVQPPPEGGQQPGQPPPSDPIPDTGGYRRPWQDTGPRPFPPWQGGGQQPGFGGLPPQMQMLIPFLMPLLQQMGGFGGGFGGQRPPWMGGGGFGGGGQTPWAGPSIAFPPSHRPTPGQPQPWAGGGSWAQGPWGGGQPPLDPNRGERLPWRDLSAEDFQIPHQGPPDFVPPVDFRSPTILGGGQQQPPGDQFGLTQDASGDFGMTDRSFLPDISQKPEGPEAGDENFPLQPGQGPKTPFAGAPTDRMMEIYAGSPAGVGLSQWVSERSGVPGQLQANQAAAQLAQQFGGSSERWRQGAGRGMSAGLGQRARMLAPAMAESQVQRARAQYELPFQAQLRDEQQRSQRQNQAFNLAMQQGQQLSGDWYARANRQQQEQAWKNQFLSSLLGPMLGQGGAGSPGHLQQDYLQTILSGGGMRT